MFDPIRRVAAIITLGLFGAIATGCGAASTTTSSAGAVPSEVRITYTTCICFTPEVVAIQKGWLKAELDKLHVRLVLQKYDTGVAQDSALLANALDIALPGATPTVSVIAQGGPATIFMLSDNEDSIEGLVARNGSGINKVADLKGRTVGVPFGSTSDYGLAGALDSVGLSRSDVHIVNLAPASLTAAWQKKEVDAAYVWDPFLTNLVESGGHLVQTIGQLKAATNGKYQIVDLYLAREDFARKYPTVLRAVATAIDRAAKYVNSNPAATASEVYGELGIPSADAALTQIKGDHFYDATEDRSAQWLGTPGHVGGLAQLLEGVWEFSYNAGKVSSKPSLDVIKAHIDPSAIQGV